MLYFEMLNLNFLQKIVAFVVVAKIAELCRVIQGPMDRVAAF